MSYPRDLIGYGRRPPDPVARPGAARAADRPELRGGRRALRSSTATPSPRFSCRRSPGCSRCPARATSGRVVYEYGSRAGFWRLLRLFAERDLRSPSSPSAMALERHPEAARAIVEAGHEVVEPRLALDRLPGHGRGREREHMRRAVESLSACDGRRPARLVHGAPEPQHAPPRRRARRLPLRRRRLQRRPAVLGGVDGKPHLVVPYTLDNNDMRFGTPQGFNTGDDFFTYLRDAFDML